MTITPQRVQELVEVLKRRYPNWTGFKDADFAKDEITYKRATIAMAQKELSAAELKRLLDTGAFDEFISRLEAIGRDNNLLYQAVPTTGDLGILYHATLDKPAFCRAMFDLLHGPDAGHLRLTRYTDFVKGAGLPNKWTFPTYFLFVCHPESEMFIKPRTTRWFVEFAADYKAFASTPTPFAYVVVKQLAEQLLTDLSQFGPRDMVDIQSFIWVCASLALQGGAEDGAENPDGLPEPFGSIFQDKGEAEWAFAFLRETAERLGIAGVDDPRVALTLRRRSRAALRKAALRLEDGEVSASAGSFSGRFAAPGDTLRLNFGQWLIVGFRSSASAPNRMGLALLSGLVDLPRQEEDFVFARKPDEAEVGFYVLPVESLRNMDGRLREAYEKTMAFIATKFRDWKGSPFRAAHKPTVFQLVFDEEKRKKCFAKGLDLVEAEDGAVQEKWAEQHKQEAEEPPFFTPTTFELLAGLKATPTKDFYTAHKAEIKAQVEEPFRRLFEGVRERVREEIRESMETEKKVFSRILKNDYGVGGAWDFLWAAFYPKGGERTKDVQLWVSIHDDRLEAGFSFGEYSQEKQKVFLANLRSHRDSFASLLEAQLAPLGVFYGSRELWEASAGGSSSAMHFVDWIDQIEELSASLRVVWLKNDLLAFPAGELSEKLAHLFNALFPLVLVVTEPEPIPAIREYLEIGNATPVVPDLPTTPLPPRAPPPPKQPEYPLASFAADTGFDVRTLESWVRAVNRKGQAIIYGPPGTGKTFMAEKLAAHVIGGGGGFSDLVQVHPAYAYEDFMQGLRPQTNGTGGLHYPLVPGRFLEFCKRAATRTGPCVLIIDEINRANLSRVFGELMYLLEYRQREIPLAGGGAFRIPEHVRLIGTMNTADRSIALVDHALRRRFGFIALYPRYEVLREFHAKQETGFATAGLIEQLKKVNEAIVDPHYHLGLSFFLRTDLAAQLPDIWQMEIEPYLEEFFFDQPERFAQFRWDNVKANVLP